MIIEEVIIQYLSKVLGVSVYGGKPSKDIPTRYVLVEKTGSSRVDYINTADIVLQSYAESMIEAARLNEDVKSAMDSIIEHKDIYKAKLNTDYNYTDTTKKQYRYQAVYQVTY